jgi:hypothetical protein
MSAADDAYQAYMLRCHGLGIQPMNRGEYEKFICNLPNAGPNNTDAILRNNNVKKDRNK